MTLSPDPHGQAALMLCEGLMLLLVEKGLIERAEAVDTVAGVIEVKQEIAGVSEAVVVSVASIALLQSIGRSMFAASVPKQDAGA